MKRIKMKKIVFTISILLFAFTVAFAQSAKTYSGKISDENGVAIAGAVVSGDEGKTQVLTNENGEFTIDIQPGTKLLIKAKGFDLITVAANTASAITLAKPVYLTSQRDLINVPFTQVEKRNTTGAVTQIDVQKELETDQRLFLGAALNGKVSGMFGARDVWGRGNAIYVIDGIPREDFTTNLLEVESITVLKDPVSRALYGAQADQGVILVKTKRGKANVRELSFRAEAGTNTAKALPEFLGAADYMTAYNQALANDGGVAKYTTEQIGMAGQSPFYPDEDFYSDTYLKSSTQYFNVNGTASGGNESTRYLVNMGWYNNSGWYQLGDASQNTLRLRGNVDYDINDNIKMKLDGIALLHFSNSPNITDYWERAASTVPNAYPALWDPNQITDEAVRADILDKAKTVNGMLLGGNNTYNQNLYGDFVRGGNRTDLYRYMQINTGLDWDLNKITPGLKASAMLTFDFLNNLSTSQGSKYKVYNPLMLEDGTMGVQEIGEDKSVGNYSTEAASAFFQRRIGLFGTLSYDKEWGDNDLSVTGVAYRDQLSMRDSLQDKKNLHFGVTANYVLKDKYLLDVAAVALGSQKLAKADNYAISPSVGLGWILSEEDFLNDSETFDFVKLRANFGILKNDMWDNYHLYETAYQRGGNFFYDNRNSSNEEMNYVTRASNIGWQSRREIVLGFDAAMLDKQLWIEASFFNSKAANLVTEMEYTYPTLMGAVPFYSNYNANSDQGVDLGIRYTKETQDWGMTVGSNLLYSVPKRLTVEEPIYDDVHSYLSKEGTAGDAIWGLEADGLYAESDFSVVDYTNQVFTLKDGMPVSSYGNVQPGDIKYIDQDGNGIIDNEDQKEIGNNSPRMQYSLYLQLRVKQFELYALGIGQVGDYNMRFNEYHRFYGELKYPEFAKEAYGPSNKDLNAEYPRLSSTKNNNNFRNSSYWMYENNWFKLPTLQVTYNIARKNISGIVKDASVYLRATDLVTISKNKALTEVNFDSAPQTRTFSIGFVTKF